jgi:integrase
VKRQVHIERQLLSVSTDAVTGEFKLNLSLPKGRRMKKKRTRVVDISEGTLALLREHKRHQAEVKMKNRKHYAEHHLVFACEWAQHSSKNSVLGHPLPRAIVGTQLKRFCKSAAVKQITPHGLRHTCATLWLAAGAPIPVVQERLWHSEPTVTMNVYTHALPGAQADYASPFPFPLCPIPKKPSAKHP